MTIDEALKILDDLDEICDPITYANSKKAIKLGIEALERVKDCRKVLCNLGQKRLPGETKE